jgi:hypothetical protein
MNSHLENLTSTNGHVESGFNQDNWNMYGCIINIKIRILYIMRLFFDLFKQY